MTKIIALLVIAVSIVGCTTTKNSQQNIQAPTATLDFGDFSSQTLTTKAWVALGEGKYADAMVYSEKCAELYELEARNMQASLRAKAPRDRVHDYWALNDVGTSYFIRGEALIKLEMNTEAMAAFKVVRDELFYAQAWDPKGWFWLPADAAATKAMVLEAKASNDF